MIEITHVSYEFGIMNAYIVHLTVGGTVYSKTYDAVSPGRKYHTNTEWEDFLNKFHRGASLKSLGFSINHNARKPVDDLIKELTQVAETCDSGTLTEVRFGIYYGRKTSPIGFTTLGRLSGQKLMEMVRKGYRIEACTAVEA